MRVRHLSALPQGLRGYAYAVCVALALVVPNIAGCGYSYETGGGKPAAVVVSADSSDVLAAPDVVEAPDAAPPTLESSGWWAKDSFVHYGVKVSNPNAQYAAHNVAVHVVLRDESGDTMHESTDVIAEIGPGETVGFAGTSGDGWAPATVDIELLEDSITYSDATEYVSPFAISALTEKDMGEFRYELTGQVANNTASYVSTVDLHALLVDDKGNIVAGYTAESYKIKPGQTKNFTHTINSAPDHANVELYAQPRY